MSKKHEIIEDGERYLSHVAIKKKLKISKKQLHQWANAGKVRTVTRDVARGPHKLTNDPQLELHYYNLPDVEKVSQDSGEDK